jgi:DNA-binding MarR family transcriptional regulator
MGTETSAASGIPRDYEEYVQAIADARYTIRRVQRIIDEQARSVDLEPLQHQALLQVYAADGSMLSVKALSERLDIPIEVASRLVKHLEAEELLHRRRARKDRRVTEVHVTTAGQARVHQILREVIPHVQGFAAQLDEETKLRSLMVFAFYLGMDLPPQALRDMVEGAQGAPLWPTRQ